MLVVNIFSNEAIRININKYCRSSGEICLHGQSMTVTATQCQPTRSKKYIERLSENERHFEVLET